MDVVERVAARMGFAIGASGARRAYLMFSGGKDSTVLLLALQYLPRQLRERIVVVYNIVAGNTHEWNVRFAFYAMREIAGCEDICVVASPPYENIKRAVGRGCRCVAIVARTYFMGDFWGGVREWGVPFPRRSRHRWCANEFKHKHWEALPASIVHNKPWRVAIVGIRADESAARRKYARLHRNYIIAYYSHATKTLDVNIVPLVDVSRDEVVDALKQYGVWSRMAAYRRVNDSLNCVYCPMRTLDKQRAILDAVKDTATGREIIRRAVDALREAKERGRCGRVSCPILEAWLDASIRAYTRMDRRVNAGEG